MDMKMPRSTALSKAGYPLVLRIFTSRISPPGKQRNVELDRRISQRGVSGYTYPPQEKDTGIV